MAGERILVVDDSPEITRFVKQYVLEPLGYQPLTAANGEDGLSIAMKEKPDLILLDLRMPKMNGYQMLLALRAQNYQAPVIFMTLHGSETIAVDVFRLGVRDYLIKPFTMDEVRQAIDRALRETRLRHEKALIDHDLTTAEAVRKTIVTLSHYLNNNLMIVQTGLAMIQDVVNRREQNPRLILRIINDCGRSLKQVNAVMSALQKTARFDGTIYHGQTSMIDIEKAIQMELDRENGVDLGDDALDVKSVLN
ncbi:MAG: response regulator [Anaerolineae bacterium]|jgi:DNA-binding response OmpR family regulator|nr:response regulator [Anaerolineae bacterium]